MKRNNEPTLCYDDVLLVPKYSDIRSRSEIDISTKLCDKIELSLPMLSSPMDTVSETSMADAMSNAGGCAIIHRYNSIDEQTSLISDSQAKNVGAAIGTTGDYLERAISACEAGANMICVDVAHGHHILMKEALESLRKHFGKSVHIMAGNVATLDGINDLAAWGADSVRCNIGGGSICSTRIQTGHGVPGLQTIIECAKTEHDVTIIADGGIKNSGDIVKALAAGADAVMVGSMLAGTAETPGDIYKDNNGVKWKTYRGMASKDAQINWRGKYASLEGVSARVPYRGSVADVLSDIERGIRSGFSYSGARNMIELWTKSEFIVQTNAGMKESQTHITTRNS